MAKFRATSTVTWDFDSDLPPDEALEVAKRQIEAVSQGITGARTGVRIDRLKEKVQKVRLGEFRPDEVIPFITKEDVKRDYTYDGQTHAVKMNSQRYFLFRECMHCVSCDLPGTRMLLEHHPADKSPHFNLYGEEDGKLVLMTKDHIHPKSCGGEDRHSNYQTMCLICNNLKGHANLTIEGIRELRKTYKENKDLLTKKKLHILIEELKLKLARPWAEPAKRKKKLPADSVQTVYDIGIWRAGSELIGKSIYDSVDPAQKYVACIRKGVHLEPLLSFKNKVVCKLSDTEVVSIPQSLLRQKDG